MGLCKCPKKKVTNLFCFEHRVNVCEHCLVSNHPKCIVQSYLQWLQDSDYDPACRLCGQNLGEGDDECVRLTCYDVFHWRCMDKYARTLPANTAPAGYTCPTCKSGVFPASNLVSPVADALRQILSKVNWARAGLGLPLIEEPPLPPTEGANSSHQYSSSSQPQNTSQHHKQALAATSASASTPAPPYRQVEAVPAEPARPGPPAYKPNPQSVVSMDDSTPYSRDPRKLFDTTSGDHLTISHDHDEDKYKRRPAFQWILQWFKSNSNLKRRHQDQNAALKRTAVLLILALLVLLTLVVIFTRVGRASADKDPFLDPMANPNIKVANN